MYTVTNELVDTDEAGQLAMYGIDVATADIKMHFEQISTDKSRVEWLAQLLNDEQMPVALAEFMIEAFLSGEFED